MKMRLKKIARACRYQTARAVTVGTSLVLAAPFAMAQGADPGVDAITALSAKATTYITAAFAVAVLVAGGFWGIKMMKKAFANAK